MSDPSPADRPHPRGEPSLGIPLPEEWLDHACSIASTARGAGVERMRDVEIDRVAAEDLLGRPATEPEWNALRAAVRSNLLLARLVRESAPAELDGLVVASLHAGHRQTRAAGYAASLAPQRAPLALDDLVEARVRRSPSPRPAPDAERGDAFGGPAVSGGAPAELDGLVADICARGSEVRCEDRASRSVPRRFARIAPWQRASVSVAAAAALVLMVTAGLRGWDFGEPRTDPRESGSVELADRGRSYPTFAVERVEWSDLAAGDRQILGTLGAVGFGGRSR